jgi:DHA3 family macrolide efflux protein-like MFS transporter
MAQSVPYRKKGRHALLQSDMRDFTLLWIGQVVSLVGSGMTCFAQSIYVYTDLGGTITNLMLLAALAQLPGVLISPLAGVVADRWDRRWVMLISDSVAALATLTLRILVVSDAFEIWQMYVIVVVISMANHFQWPAYFATIPLMVPKERLGYANGLVQVARSLSGIAAPFMAGLAVTAFHIQGVILFDLGSYLFASAMLFIIRIPPTPKTVASQASRSSFWQETIYGWKYLSGRPGLLGLLSIFAIANFLFANVSILFFALALSITSASVLGSVLSIGGVSALAGSLMMGAWGGPKRRIYGVLGFIFVQGLALVLMGLRPSVVFLFGAYIMFMLASPFVNANSGAIWQSKVPPDVQGRVLAASGMVSTTALELGYLSSGPLADHIFEPLLADNGLLASSIGRIIGTGPGRGVGLMFIILGVLTAAVAVGGYLYPRVRLLDEELPDAITDAAWAEMATSGQVIRPTFRQVDLMVE